MPYISDSAAVSSTSGSYPSPSFGKVVCSIFGNLKENFDLGSVVMHGSANI